MIPCWVGPCFKISGPHVYLNRLFLLTFQFRLFPFSMKAELALVFRVERNTRLWISRHQTVRLHAGTSHWTPIFNLCWVLKSADNIWCPFAPTWAFFWNIWFFAVKIWMPKRAWIQVVNSCDVNSSFPSILASIKFVRSIVVPRDGRPGFVGFLSDCLSLNLVRNRVMLQWLIFT